MAGYLRKCRRPGCVFTRQEVLCGLLVVLFGSSGMHLLYGAESKTLKLAPPCSKIEQIKNPLILAKGLGMLGSRLPTSYLLNYSSFGPRRAASMPISYAHLPHYLQSSLPPLLLLSFRCPAHGQILPVSYLFQPSSLCIPVLL
jgi:hypothetical protein